MLESNTCATLFPERIFNGVFGAGEIQFDATFVVRIDAQGEAHIRIEPLSDLAKLRPVEIAWQNPAARLRFRLTGNSSDGYRFDSDSVVVSSFSHQCTEATRHAITPIVQYETAKITAVQSDSIERPFVRMRLKGFECFHSHEIHCPIGTVHVGGVRKLADPDLVTGQIAVCANAIEVDVASWVTEAEHLCWFLRSYLSFASGVSLKAPVVELGTTTEVNVHLRSQVRQIRPQMQTFSSLNLEPLLESVIAHYFSKKKKIEGVRRAIEWIAQESTYKEMKLFGAVVALEHILDCNLEESDKLIVSKSEFNALKKTLQAQIDCQLALSEEQRGLLKSKLAELNRRTLREKLRLFAERWEVPLTGIDDARIARAVSARNQVFHTGQFGTASADEHWEHVMIVREIMVRIVLADLKFKGQYQTYLGGARWTQFPPCTDVHDG